MIVPFTAPVPTETGRVFKSGFSRSDALLFFPYLSVCAAVTDRVPLRRNLGELGFCFHSHLNNLITPNRRTNIAVRCITSIWNVALVYGVV